MTETLIRIEPQPEKSIYALLDTDPEAPKQKIGEVAYLDVVEDGVTHRIMYHTLVDEAYGGQGLASRLVEAAIEDAVSQSMKIVPLCPYIKAWLPKHTEYEEHVVEATKTHIRAVMDSQKQ